MAVATQSSDGWQAIGFAREYMVMSDHSPTEDEAYRTWEQRACDALQTWNLGSFFAQQARPVG